MPSPSPNSKSLMGRNRARAGTSPQGDGDGACPLRDSLQDHGPSFVSSTAHFCGGHSFLTWAPLLFFPAPSRLHPFYPRSLATGCLLPGPPPPPHPSWHAARPSTTCHPTPTLSGSPYLLLSPLKMLMVIKETFQT